MRSRWIILIVILAGAAVTAFAAGMAAFCAVAGRDSSVFGSRVGVITVKGPIISADDAVRDIAAMKRDDGVKAVVLRIETPGGSVGASQEILEAVRLLAEVKPVVASMGSIAASGGYYLACGATKILANPGTITGSIGVRMEHVAIGDLLRWAKVDVETLKSGRYKDIGSIDRPLGPEEKEILQGVLDELREQFKGTVAAARNLPMEKVDALADGRMFTGTRAVELGLVDGTGGFAEAIKLAAELGGIKGEPELSYPKKRGGWIKRMMEAAGGAAGSLAASADDHWRPAMKM
ncbi:MAG: signal peptide peptidase SppA [Proteobacteria bacterium]|nr:signal peptide peptidase SppA [Pseudomonadota bacterium]